MIGKWRARRAPAPLWLPAVPPGERYYAIGDIHGCDGLLRQLFAMIEAEDAQLAPARRTLLFLGDYVDRGPASRSVIDMLMTVDQSRVSAIFLMGNHEEILLSVLDGLDGAAALFDQVGGRETLASYGADPDLLADAEADALADLARACIPAEHQRWIRGLQASHRAGDYLFVHAGIRPGVAIEDQDPREMRWIRGDFLTHEGPHGVMVVHGHSAGLDIDERENRLGIDTGAYVSGVLTAVCLEDNRRWFIQTPAHR